MAEVRSWPIVQRLEEEAQREREEALRTGKPLTDTDILPLIGPGRETFLLALRISEALPSLSPRDLEETWTPSELLETHLMLRARSHMADQAARMERDWQRGERAREKAGRDRGEYLDPDN